MEKDINVHKPVKPTEMAKNDTDKNDDKFQFLNFLHLYPPFLCNRAIEKYFGGFLSLKTIQNRNSQNTGPLGAFKCGKAKLYNTKEFLRWLDEMVENTQDGAEKESGTAKKKRRGRKTKEQEVKERRGIN